MMIRAAYDSFLWLYVLIVASFIYPHHHHHHYHHHHHHHHRIVKDYLERIKVDRPAMVIAMADEVDVLITVIPIIIIITTTTTAITTTIGQYE